MNIEIHPTPVQEVKLHGLASPTGLTDEEYMSTIVDCAMDRLLELALRSSVVRGGMRHDLP